MRGNGWRRGRFPSCCAPLPIRGWGWCRARWSHYDIDRQIDRENIPDLQKNQPQESMKYIFQIPNARTDTEKGFLRI